MTREAMLIIRLVPVTHSRHAFRVTTVTDTIRSAPVTEAVGSSDEVRQVVERWLAKLESSVTPSRRGRD